METIEEKIVEAAMDHDRDIPFDEKKFDALLLHLASLTKDDTLAGATKFNKLMFLIDFEAYRRFGKPLTGACYGKRKYGPVPDPIEGRKRALVADGSLADNRSTQEYEARRLIPKRPADTSLFSTEELALVDEVVAATRSKSGTDLKLWSHDLPSWKFSDDEQRIPYFTAWMISGWSAVQATIPPPTAERLAEVRRRAAEIVKAAKP